MSIPKLNIHPDKLRGIFSDPTLSDITYFLFFSADRDPTESEPIVTGIGIPAGWPFWWWNTTANTWFINQVNAEDAQVWAGLSIGSARVHQAVGSPAFSTPRSPSATNDVEVSAIVSMTSTLLTASEIDAQIDSGGGYVTIASESLSGIAATTNRTLKFTVPAGSSYQLIESGTNSIIVIHELTN